MQTFFNVLWSIDYPFQLLMSFLVFFIPLKKKRNYLIYLIAGIVILFSFWQLNLLPIFDEGYFSVIPLYFAEAAIILGLIYFTIDMNFMSCLSLLSCVITTQHLSYQLTTGFYMLIDVNLMHTSYYFIASYIILFATCIAIYFLFARKLANFIDIQPLYISIVTVTLVVSVEIVLSIGEQQLFFIEGLSKLFISMVNLSSIVFSIFILVFLYISAISEKTKEENIALSLIKSKDKERYEMAKVTSESINIKAHDLKHMLRKGELNEADAKEIQDIITNYKTIIQTDNVGFDTVIYEEQLKCIKLGIDFSVLAENNCFSNFKPTHIYSMFANLIDNAIEATTGLEDDDKKTIVLKVKNIRDSIVILIENHFNKPPVIKNGIPQPSKADHINHGYGVKSVLRTVNSYNGVFNASIENDLFLVKIVFPCMQKEK